MQRHRAICLSIISGLLILRSLPLQLGDWQPSNAGWLAWIAFVPLLYVVRRSGKLSAFIYVALASFIYLLGSTHWVYIAMNRYGGISQPVSVLLTILLALMYSFIMALPYFIAVWLTERGKGNFVAYIASAVAVSEWIRNYFPFGGFRWSDISLGQFAYPAVIQICSITGIFGLIWLIMWTNAVVERVMTGFVTKKENRDYKYAVALLVPIVVIAYGFIRLNQETLSKGSLPVGLVQANIPQEDKWNDNLIFSNLKQHKLPTEDLLRGGAKLIVWPEAVFPWSVKLTENFIDPRFIGTQDIQTSYPYFLFGALSVNSSKQVYNSALLVSPQGHILDRYHKTRLAPFGEYVPYKSLLFFAEKLSPALGDFISGSELRPIAMRNVLLGAMTCYEDVFPEVARELTRKGADVLITLTNDAWFLKSSEPLQHFAHSVFRAVETGRTFMRSANTGISSLVDEKGRIKMSAPVWEKAVLLIDAPLFEQNTIYVLYGDWFVGGCAIFLALHFALILLRRSNNKIREKI